jgi:predicted HTH domain antitoxin
MAFKDNRVYWRRRRLSKVTIFTIITRSFLNLRNGTARDYPYVMSVTLEVDEQTLNCLPLAPGERERLMQIELACRFYAKGWLTLAQGARMARLDQYAFGVELAEREIPRHYSLEDMDTDLGYAGGQ